MRNYGLRPLHGVVLLLPLLALGAWAQQDTLTLENAGANYAMGGVYTSPYGISINGGSPVNLICDDFSTDVAINDSWAATQTTFAQLEAGTNPAGTPKFVPGIASPTEIQEYATVAVLAAELLALPDYATEAAGEYSFALWDVFDNTLLDPGSDPYGSLSGSELTQAQLDLTNAEALVAAATTDGKVDLSEISVNGSPIEGMTIYTPSPLGLSQEFVTVTMDEPPSVGVFAAYLLFGGVGLFFLGRSRLLRINR
jgi:hypothetical protein